MEESDFVKKQRRYEKSEFWICGVFILVLIVIGIHNYRTNENFWEMQFSSVMTLLVAVLISYLFTQRRNDRRKQKEILLKLLELIQAVTENPTSYTISPVKENWEQERQNILMVKRRLSNHIRMLKKESVNFGVQEKADKIDEVFQDYELLISENIDKMKILSENRTELQRLLDSISKYAFEIMFELYN